MGELILRNTTAWLHSDYINTLSPSAVKEIHKDRGAIQDDNSNIYTYHPFEKFNWYPHLKIDENGFRNSVNNQVKVDTVLLGDSIFFGKNSEVDVGELLRLDGVSSLNLAIGGYAPQHYRDVYKKFVIDKGIKHKSVIVSIFVGNDFHDVNRYPWKINPIGKGKTYYPWILNLLIGVIDYHKVARNYQIESKESKHRVVLPYGEIGIRWLWWPGTQDGNSWTRGDYELMEVKKALLEIINLADQSNANVSLVFTPSPSSVYGLKLYPKFKKYTKIQNDIVKIFEKEFTFPNVKIIDPTKQLAEAIEKKFLYIEESDCHFNTHGMKVFYNIITSKINNPLNE